MTTHPHLLGLTRDELIAQLEGLGLKAFRGKQVWEWLYAKGVLNPDQMTNLPQADRATLAQNFRTVDLGISTELLARDGVVKWLFKLHDGHEVEAVFIPEKERGTLCVSSQVGCTLNCRFCHTGTQGLARNLTADEIVAQVWMARSRLGDWKGKDKPRDVSNIVFMGMGEPLYNYDNVSRAIRILMDEYGMAFGSRKITLSTSGVVPEIPRISEELGVNLAISIHAPDDDTRTKIMPINKKYPLASLMDAVYKFRLKEHRKVTWEYVMLDGVNDSPAQARQLVDLLRGIPSLVNIIPFNPWPGAPFKASPKAAIDAFAQVIMDAGIPTTVRKTRGDDILAACGQLRSETSGFNTVSKQFPTVYAVYGTQPRTRVEILSPADA